MRAVRGILVFFGILGALGGTARSAHGQAADSAGAHAAATAFLTAFDSLQWEPFRAFFADDVTMFFPFGDTPARADGRAAVEERFRRFFDEAMAAWQRSGRTGAPRMGITPRDLRVQMAGTVSIVSFHLGADNPARRSLVFQHTDGGWKLVHWHASPPPQRPTPAPAANPATPAAPAPAS